MDNEPCNIEIKEAYKDFTPSILSAQITRRMLSYIPDKYLGGLRTIVLTNSGSLNHERRREKTRHKKQKVRISECRGLYHQKWNGEPAWIELFIDNIESSIPRSISWIPFFRDILFSEVLYHEIGHHIHRTKVPKHTDTENVAEDWKKRLSRIYFRRRYWYLIPILFLFCLILKPFKKYLK